MSEVASRLFLGREWLPPAAVTAGVLRSRIVTRVQEWEDLRACWDELLLASTDSTPWQSWDYLSSWWRHLGADKQLRIVVVERAQVPVLIFPLQLSREVMIGVPTRILEPISMLWDVNRPRFALGEPDEAAYRCGLEALWHLRDEWDALRIEELPNTDPQARDLERFARERGLWFRDVLSSVVPHLQLDQPWAQFLKTRGNRLRKNLRSALRKLQASGPVSVEVAESVADVERAYATMLDLHRRSWKRKKHVGLSLSDPYRVFFYTFLMNMAHKGCARILTLRTGARAVAATIAFIHRDTYFSTEIVHDAEFARASPGTLLESMELERLMTERRLRHYDFLGRFLSNKQRWTEHARVTHRIYVFRPGLKNRLLDFHYFQAKPWIKRVWRAVFGLSRVTSQAMRFMKLPGINDSSHSQHE